ncbi:hypothetical protein RJ640_029359 [Escallonia rubra]|uniref:F-box/LRR-repeat protein 15-like leucin rich repeat domain-containing protein n=1 Tax=Escallonia rubra TaxID=112253 RepID=A0AA88RRK9_9ASTE|nr:hypothetical protein RJ640_029359 [Escallonia rubra]
MKIVSTRLPQRDLISLLLVSPCLHHTLVSYPPLWLVLDFHEMSNAGDRLVAALSLERYRQVKQINLEFAQDIEDKHLEVLKNKLGRPMKMKYEGDMIPLTCPNVDGKRTLLKCLNCLQNLEYLNLNGCQKISDKGIETITMACPALKVFSIYWNIRVTDVGVAHLVKNCKHIVDLNMSGCKLRPNGPTNFDFQRSEFTCIKITDKGLQQILLNCSSLRSLNLYALSSFTDVAYKMISLLPNLRFLDLCGAQNLSDQGLSCIAKCKNLASLNLTWCVCVTDKGVIAIAEGCTSLEFLSLFGIIGVTDKCLEALSRSCSNTMTTLDVNGCVGVKLFGEDCMLQFLGCVRVADEGAIAVAPGADESQ